MSNGASIWSGANKVGLLLLAIAAAVNLVPMPAPEGAAGPPLAILIAAAVLGLIALIGVVVAWSRNNRKAALVAVASLSSTHSWPCLPSSSPASPPGCAVWPESSLRGQSWPWR